MFILPREFIYRKKDARYGSRTRFLDKILTNFRFFLLEHAVYVLTYIILDEKKEMLKTQQMTRNERCFCVRRVGILIRRAMFKLINAFDESIE